MDIASIAREIINDSTLKPIDKSTVMTLVRLDIIELFLGKNRLFIDFLEENYIDILKTKIEEMEKIRFKDKD